MANPMRFAPSSTLEDDLRRGYERATSFSPIKADERDKVFKNYGLKAGISKGQSDAGLEHTAANAVISWFKKQKADSAKKAAPKAPAPAKAPAKPAAPAKAVAPKAAPKAPAAVSPKYVSAQMAKYGFKTQPPAYALVSQAAFDAWLARAVKYATRPRSVTIKQQQGIQRVKGADIGPVSYSGPAAAPAPAKPARVGGFKPT
jgi:hypothetical protein